MKFLNLGLRGDHASNYVHVEGVVMQRKGRKVVLEPAQGLITLTTSNAGGPNGESLELIRTLPIQERTNATDTRSIPAPRSSKLQGFNDQEVLTKLPAKSHRFHKQDRNAHGGYRLRFYISFFHRTALPRADALQQSWREKAETFLERSTQEKSIP